MLKPSSPHGRFALLGGSFRRWSALAAFLGFGASAAFGQAVTTSTLSGRVADDNGAPITGAALVITHGPTGITYNTVSRDNGSFSIRGLRAGGPYSVTATATGYYAGGLRELYLGIDQDNSYEIRLRGEQLIELEEFIVTGSSLDSVFRGDRTGTGSNLTSEDLDNVPVGDRSLNSLLRLDPSIVYNRDPQDRAFSVGGISNRFNSIQVDGISVADPFGLNGSNTAAERNVIPLDAVEAITISTSPYSARRGGFVGAQVNAVTKSGGNLMSGSVFFTYRDQSMVGDTLDGVDRPLPDFKEKTLGFTIGGPIIRNKLFYYVAYERVREDKVAPSPENPVDPAALQQIVQQATALGFSPGSAAAPQNKLEDDNIMVKLDWQINDAHRLTLRYQDVEASRPTFQGFGTGNFANNFSLDSHWYDQKINNRSYIAQLISRWTDSLDTELSVSRSEYYSEPINNSRQPMLEIRGVPLAAGSGTATVTMGTERSRHANLLMVDTDTVELFGSLVLNDRHTLQFGLQYENSDVYNMFVQDAFGRYIFTGGQRTATSPTLTGYQEFLNNSTTGDWLGTYQYNFFIPGVSAAAQFEEANWGLYVQDAWRVTDNLTVFAGLRVDVPKIGDDVPYNALFEQVFGRTNTYTYDGKTAVQPRLSFNYRTGDKLKTQIRGGIGLFYGRMPRVWLSNSYSNTGSNFGTYLQNNTNTSNPDRYSGSTPPPPTPPVSGNPDTQPSVGSGVSQQVAFIEPGFKLPTRWKTNLALEQELGFFGLVASAEWQHSWVEQDVVFDNLNLRVVGTLPDGRNRYSGLVDSRFTNRIIGLNNTDKGWNQSVTIALERPRKRDGWYYKVAYTNTTAREVQFGTSSVGASNWQNRAVFNPGEDVASVAELEIKDRIIATVRKDFELVKGFRTTLSLFYEGRSGYPFSFISGSDYNGDGLSSNDLAYIPYRGQPGYVFGPSGSGTSARTAAQNEATFYQLVEAWGLATGPTTSGQARYPFVHQFDIGIKQEFRLPGFRHRLEIGLDLLNVGNLINDEWGIIRGSNQFFYKRENLANFSYNATSGVTTISAVNEALASRTFAPSLGRGEPAATRWSAMLSVRYKF